MGSCVLIVLVGTWHVILFFFLNSLRKKYSLTHIFGGGFWIWSYSQHRTNRT